MDDQTRQNGRPPEQNHSHNGHEGGARTKTVAACSRQQPTENGNDVSSTSAERPLVIVNGNHVNGNSSPRNGYAHDNDDHNVSLPPLPVPSHGPMNGDRDVGLHARTSRELQDCDLGYEDDFCEEPTEVDRVLGFVNGEALSEPRDDMERYVEENRHLLAANPPEVLEEPPLAPPVMTEMNESFEDHGDFIEADMPKAFRSYSSSGEVSDCSPKGSPTSSCEDIPKAVEKLSIGQNAARSLSPHEDSFPNRMGAPREPLPMHSSAEELLSDDGPCSSSTPGGRTADLPHQYYRLPETNGCCVERELPAYSPRPSHPDFFCCIRPIGNESSRTPCNSADPSGAAGTSNPRLSVSSEAGTSNGHANLSSVSPSCDLDESSFTDELDSPAADCMSCQQQGRPPWPDASPSSSMSSSGHSASTQSPPLNNNHRPLLRTRHSLDSEPSPWLSNAAAYHPGTSGLASWDATSNSRTMSLPYSLSAESSEGEQGLADLYDPALVNMQWLQHMTKSLDEDFLSMVLQRSMPSSCDKLKQEKKSNGAQSKSASMPRRPPERDHFLLYTQFLRDYLLTQLQDPHHSWWYQPSLEEERDIPRVMLWTEFQAYYSSVSQIGVSACGATAVINVLKFFGFHPDVNVVCDSVPTKRRAEKAPLGEYLLSRSVAGTTEEDIVSGVEKVTEGKIVGRFFHFFPRRDVCVRQWLAKWMKKGAVAVATLNMQLATADGQEVPDAWHHQMIYGVSPKGVYLTNPQQLVVERVLGQQLCSDSVLLVRRQDVVSRWNARTDLSILATASDPRWHSLNVLGQVVNLLREDQSLMASGSLHPHVTSHIQIPAAYRSGISLFVSSSSALHAELLAEPELPLLSAQPRKCYLETEID